MTRFLFLLLLLTNSAFGQTDLNKGLVAYYPFNGNADDASGNGNHAIFNNAKLTTGHLGDPKSAYRFNGKNTFIRVPDAPSLNMKNKMSIALWVRASGFYTGRCYNNMMLMKGNTDYLTGNYFIRFSDVYTGCTAPKTTEERFYGANVVAPGPTVQLGEWYSVVWTYDGTTARIYINCELKQSKTEPLSFINSHDLFMGRMNDPQYPYWLNGDLDEVRIYNRALTYDEVLVYCGSKKMNTIPCQGADRPSAKFDYSISNCTTVSFELNKPDKNNTKSVKWSFGDGSNSNQLSPVHTFNKFGNYKVRAIVTNRKGCTDTVLREIRLSELKVDFVYAEKGEPGEVEFKANNNLASYSWDLGNGTKAENTTVATATFTATGDYPVTMFAKNNTGCKVTVTKNVGIKLPDLQEKVTGPIIPLVETISEERPLPEKREKDLQRIIHVDNDSVSISVYDNGIVDGDSVTLVYNDKIIATHLFLSSKPISFTIKIDDSRASNELLMYAENLGSIPPNTSLMVIKDGEKRHTVNITSSKTSNGIVSFILDKKKITASQ